jgi:hypothetical protein
LIGQLTTNEAQEISKLTTQYFNEGQSPVHIIINVTEVQGFPTNLRQNTSLADYLSHPSLGWTVVVGGSVLVNFMLSVIAQVLKFRNSKRATVEEAVAFLLTQDNTLTVKP